MRVLFFAAGIALVLVLGGFWILAVLVEPSAEDFNFQNEKWVEEWVKFETLEEALYSHKSDNETEIQFVVRHGIESATGYEASKLVVLSSGLPSETQEIIKDLGKLVMTRSEWETYSNVQPEDILWVLRIRIDSSGAVFRATYGNTAGNRNCGAGSFVNFHRNNAGLLIARDHGIFRC